MNVAYFDFEMTDSNLKSRFMDSNYSSSFDFADNFLRIDFDPDFINNVDDWDTFIIEQIEDVILKTNSTFIVIDNITALTISGSDDVSVAKNIMTRLVNLKKRYQMTILILAHMPKSL